MIIKSESTPVIWTVIIRLTLVFKPSEPTPNLKWIFVKWFWISTPDRNNTVPVTFQLLYLKSLLRVYNESRLRYPKDHVVKAISCRKIPWNLAWLSRATRWTDDEKNLGLGTRRNRSYSIHPVLGLFLLIELKSNLSFLWNIQSHDSTRFDGLTDI